MKKKITLYRLRTYSITRFMSENFLFIFIMEFNSELTSTEYRSNESMKLNFRQCIRWQTILYMRYYSSVIVNKMLHCMYGTCERKIHWLHVCLCICVFVYMFVDVGTCGWRCYSLHVSDVENIFNFLFSFQMTCCTLHTAQQDLTIFASHRFLYNTI